MLASGSGSGKEAWVDEPHSKRPKYEEVEDRISNIPDELKTHIISHVPFRSALKTYILSKSWRNIFCSLPNLSFIESDFDDIPERTHRLSQLSALIDWTVANREGYGIRTLIIHSNRFQRSWLILKNAWVDFAVQNNVQFLELIAEIDETGLPSSIFSCRSLVVFKLMTQLQLLKLPSTIYLPNLKQMCLVTVIFTDDAVMENLFTGCPLLNHLSIRRCCMTSLKRLKISCLKLNTLWISDCSKIDKCIIDIQCENVENFYYEGGLAQDFEFGNMETLKMVWLNIAGNREDGRNYGELAPVALNLLRGSCHARSLTINIVFNQVLLEARGELWKLSCFKNLMNVRLFLWASKEYWEIGMTLLRKFRLVRKLQIVIYQPGSDNMLDVLHPENYHLSGIFRHLEHLLMDNFKGSGLEMGLLKFFLENVKSLIRVTVRIPPVAINLDGEFQSVGPFSDQVKQFITDEVRPLTDNYPTVILTVLGATETINC